MPDHFDPFNLTDIPPAVGQDLLAVLSCRDFWSRGSSITQSMKAEGILERDGVADKHQRKYAAR